MITAAWSLQRADHGEQPYWAVMLLAAMLGQIGLPGGGFGFGYGSPPAWATRAWRSRAGDGAAPEPAQHLDPGGAHRRPAAASRRALRVQRQALHLSRYQAGLLGRRQSVPPSSGPQSAACAPGSGPRPSSSTSRGGPRPRAMPTSCCRRRPRSSATTSARAARPLHHRDAAGHPAARRGAQRFRHLQCARRTARLARHVHRRPRRDGLAAPSLRPWRASERANAAPIPDFDTFWRDGFVEFRQPPTNTCCSTNSAPIRLA